MSNELGSMHNKIVPRQFEDLRGWIDALRDEANFKKSTWKSIGIASLARSRGKPSAKAMVLLFYLTTSQVTAKETMSIRAASSPAGCQTTSAWQ